MTTRSFFATRRWPWRETHAFAAALARLKPPTVEMMESDVRRFVGGVLGVAVLLFLVVGMRFVGPSPALFFAALFVVSIAAPLMAVRPKRLFLLLSDDRIAIRLPVHNVRPRHLKRIVAVAVAQGARVREVRPAGLPTFHPVP